MQRHGIDTPYNIITWQDKGNTDAIGWIVIHSLANGIAGGGLFMHESATLQEVKDLAYTMSLKNSLQQPVFGGGKGGIKFDPTHPEAKAVLKRFLQDNRAIIGSTWCTGGDLNTTTQEITSLLAEVSQLKSPFFCLANMLQIRFDIDVCLAKFQGRLHAIENTFFTIEQAVTGYSIVKAIDATVKIAKPKIIVQGFGKVGRAFCYYAQQHYTIIGICERDWFIYNEDGLDIEQLLLAKSTHSPPNLQAFNPVYRDQAMTAETFLLDFLSQARADIFSPCATRYTITRSVLTMLISKTFSASCLHKGFIVAGANNVFSDITLIEHAEENGITVIPEWISNSGSAILFMEALKYQGTSEAWPMFIKQQIADRIHIFIKQAKQMAHNHRPTLYQASVALANIQMQEPQLVMVA